jgi:hypothetical protein
VQVFGHQFFYRRKDRDTVFGSSILGAARIWFDRGNKSDSEPTRFEFAIDTEMIATKGAGSSYRNTQDGLAGRFYAPLPSTALRQRV